MYCIYQLIIKKVKFNMLAFQNKKAKNILFLSVLYYLQCRFCQSPKPRSVIATIFFFEQKLLLQYILIITYYLL